MQALLTKIDFRHAIDDFRQLRLTTDGNPLGFRHRRQRRFQQTAISVNPKGSFWTVSEFR